MAEGQDGLREDILRCGWMTAVGALDAYFCDAYSDIVAASMIARSRDPDMDLPEFFYDIKVPIRAVLEHYPHRKNWRWRMAARNLMLRDNVLSLKSIQGLFNAFLHPRDRRFFRPLLPRWIIHPAASPRLFGITQAAFNALQGQQREQALDDAFAQFEDRFRDIFQRRHDCIHNCDRPKMKLQRLRRPGTVAKVVEDVEFLVLRCDEHIAREFRAFLVRAGCSSTTIASVGYGT